MNKFLAMWRNLINQLPRGAGGKPPTKGAYGKGGHKKSVTRKANKAARLARKVNRRNAR